MKRKREGILDILLQSSWWISICLGGICYIALKFVFPSLEFDNPIFKGLATGGEGLAPIVAIILFFVASSSAFNSFRKRRLLDKQNGIDSICSLSWKEFEELIAEAYRRQGYFVKENLHAGPDGGIDITLQKDGETLFVQCKQWRSCKVGVKIVREMLGLVTAHNANKGIIVTCGHFTKDAVSFASENVIELIDQNQLMKLIQGVQSSPVSYEVDKSPADVKTCPKCGSKMVERVAGKGKRKGTKFRGCSSFPECRYTEDLQN
ncbi:MAG: DUF2034 domain-containing protein [Verrucomicrobiales bacterium]|nr:DUF2034 domain-containing protein [Verrucomicrobiales bacterium]